ncbi:MAG: anti-sigma factor domain-containing protein [Janthinobacterium lividum]
MTINGYLEDDNLILYAMQALSDTEAAAVAEELAGNQALQQRLADIRITLGVYAEATVDHAEVPQGSLDRLLAALPRPTSNIVTMPAPVEQQKARTTASTSILGWSGWAIAAMALVTLGVEHRHKLAANQLLQQQTAQVQQKNAVVEDLARERESLQKSAQEAAQQTNASRAELSTYKDQSAALSAKVAAEATRAQRESSRASDLASVAAENAREAERLRGTLANQQDQVAQLSAQANSASAQAENARQVLDALSDPTALRVTLTVPKQKKTPSGRGTYVPNRGTLLFTASNLPALHGNRVYELWLMPADGSNPIPAGTFVPDAQGNATVVSTSFQRSIAAKGFAITAEPAGGSQTPTLPILLAGL